MYANYKFWFLKELILLWENPLKVLELSSLSVNELSVSDVCYVFYSVYIYIDVE